MKVKEIFELIKAISDSYEIDQNIIKDNLIFSFEKAYLKEYPDVIFKMDIDLENNKMRAWEEKVVVDDSMSEDLDDDKEITYSDALQYSTKAKIGEIIEIPVLIDELDRRIAIHVKQLFEQKISEQSNSVVYSKWNSRIGENIVAEVENDHNRYVEVNLGDTKGALLKANQIPGERLQIGKKYEFYIKDVKEQTKGWPIILSRNDQGLVENLLRRYVSEIDAGLIEIKAIARIPGFKTKVAVKANQEGIDPIGTCVGPEGSRIKEINRIICADNQDSKNRGEFVDIILWDEDPKQFLVNACAPEQLIGVEITDDEDSADGLHKFVTLVVNEETLPKVIGKSGMNIKLISRLTNWAIDIVDEKTAIEDEIKYELVGHLVPIKPASTGRPNFNNYMQSNNQKPRQQRPKQTSVDAAYNYGSNDDYVTVYDNYNSRDLDITDEDIESLINFNTAPKKEKPVDIEIDLEESFSREEKNTVGPKHKKSRNKTKATVNQDANNLLEEFGDIADDFMLDDFTMPENDYEQDEDEQIGSDNLELDEE